MADKQFFKHLQENNIPKTSILNIGSEDRILIISDLHMGCGSRDDLDRNGELVISILEDYYLINNYILILNGDIEELQKFSLDYIKEKWIRLYNVFNKFASKNRLYKIIGNHDEHLRNKRCAAGYPFKIHDVVKINTNIISAYVFHGHQLSGVYAKFNHLFGIFIRYFLKPLGIKNISDSRNPYKRFSIEKKAYSFSMKNRCLSIIGHTHRALFESLSRFDYIKFEIENLCQAYPASTGAERERIENEVKALRKELGKLKRKEKRDLLKQSLYGDELPVPCLFNSGCALGKKGIYGIEMTNEDIALVYWFKEGKSKKFVTRGGYEIESIKGTPYRKAELNHNKLDYISAKINLLGN